MSRYRLSINKDDCIDCGLCERKFPGIVERGELVISGWVLKNKECRDKINSVIDRCEGCCLSLDRVN